MTYVSPFSLDRKQRDAITVEELAGRALKILQLNFTSKGHDPYGKGSLPGIYEGELLATSHPHEREDLVFRQKWTEAIQYLRRKALIVNDAGQDSDQFVVLTEAERQQDVDEVIVGISSADSYLLGLERTAGELDPVVRQYLRESYRAFEQDLYLASIFMLGAASERVLFMLAEAVDQLLDDDKHRDRLKQLSRAREVKEWILESLHALRKKRVELKSLLIDVQDKIETLFTLYRYQRNEVGHPRDDEMVPEPATIKAMLQSFGLYLSACMAIVQKATS